MKRFAILLAVFLFATGARAEIRTEPEVQAGDAFAAQAKARRAPPARIMGTSLGDFVVPKARAEAPGLPQQVGFARTVPVLDSRATVARFLAWEETAGGGSRAAVSVTAPGAAATRLGLEVAAAPAGAVFRFYPLSGDSPYEVAYAEIAAQLRAGGSSGRADAIYWSPVVEGETQVVEIELPAGASPAGLQLSIPLASHLVTSAESAFAVAKVAASCNVDAMCHQDVWSLESNAVARIIFTDGGSSFVCSGTLLADRDTSTSIPYFLTANHCISTQAAASTLQTYWFYRSTACAGSVRGAFQTRTGGATLLYAAAATDTSFLRLNAAPPAGATYAGWIVGTVPALGAGVTGIHHPTGDLLKISFGTVRGYYACTPTSDDDFSCTTRPSSSATFYSVNWARGITETGSSGSGLFLDSGKYLVGQLYGGNGGCGGVSNDYYGRLDVAYNQALSQWLGTGTPSAPTVVPEHDYSDLWWNAAESGWGLSITQHGSSTLFGAWYLYDALGNPQWLVMPGGRWTTPTTFTTDVYAATGPDPTGTFDPSRVERTRVGSATLTFQARDRATLAYTVNGISGSKVLTRQPFGAAVAGTVGSYADMWWVATESGWGLSISQQYSSLFAVWYSYRPDGNATWYVAPSGNWVGPDTWSGTLYRTAYAPRGFLGATFDPTAVNRLAVGTLTLRFSGSGSATMSWTLDGVAGSKQITRQPF